MIKEVYCFDQGKSKPTIETQRKEMVGWLVGWLVEFYGISTSAGYLTTNPFLCE